MPDEQSRGALVLCFFFGRGRGVDGEISQELHMCCGGLGVNLPSIIK